MPIQKIYAVNWKFTYNDFNYIFKKINNEIFLEYFLYLKLVQRKHNLGKHFKFK